MASEEESLGIKSQDRCHASSGRTVYAQSPGDSAKPGVRKRFHPRGRHLECACLTISSTAPAKDFRTRVERNWKRLSHCSQKKIERERKSKREAA